MSGVFVTICIVLMGITLSLVTGDEYHNAEKLNRKTRGFFSERTSPLLERDASFWLTRAHQVVAEKASVPLNTNQAKNIILFLGDGMSIPTLTASRIFKGQLKGQTGEEEWLSFEKFPYSGLSKTYCANSQVADSACSATAYLCGIKNNILTVGVNGRVNINNCTASNNPLNQVESIAKWAQNAGKATGIVTTTTVTHASPSGAYAHSSNRQWESDNDVLTYGGDPNNCKDIADQLITRHPGKNFNVILGGGRGKFIPKKARDISGKNGERIDGRNLIRQWQADHPWGVYVNNRDALLTTDYSETDHLLGLFGYSHLDFYSAADKTKQPSLSEMTEAAIRVVEKNINGYFLFIEGGLIDHAHHGTVAKLALSETLEFENAVAKALEMTNSSETLIVVTSDHSHTMSITGYPGRGNDITNLNEYDEAADGLKYSTLSYAAGPMQYLDEFGKRVDLTGKFNDYFQYPSYIKADTSTHGGDDVAIFANGPHAHLFCGIMEQNMIPYLMAYASCIGKGRTVCNPLLCRRK